ncbi:MAG: alanine--tRNA ligase [Gemmatimonadetes bacterium]|nr:alanine--tRNA ligase [Gemmatimonadota bacterium]
MRASEIRTRFLEYFRRHGHAVLPSSSLVPGDDPTLLFTNAGMVQFKKVFLGMEQPAHGRRATTSQKCVRAGGKHNDLEQVGHTARHHTFFEMLGNFSFGDYFKRDAIRFAWDWVTGPVAEGGLGMDPRHLRVSVFREDDEARALWREVAGLPDSRIYGLGEKDNFWQMADTGPCGPCSEIYVDLAHLARDWRFPDGASGEWTDLAREEFSEAAFVEGGEAGRFLEIWNLVFMQFDRQADGTLVPLPKPSVDTGAGLERIAAALQGVTNNFHTDVFAPLIARIEEVVGRPYQGRSATATEREASYRVIADHARAVAFLLADGVFPSNEGRGYVLRRILRRAVRHAWLLGRREPTLVHVVQRVIETLSDVYPELAQRASHIAETTRAEEERFLATIEGGMRRFDELAPAGGTGTIAGDDVFRLYDTFGFPLDLTELMARERGYGVDVAGFETALAAQRTQSQEERKSRKLGVDAGAATEWAWETASGTTPTAGAGIPSFVGYQTTSIETQVTAIRRLEDGRVAVMLRETPFYAESGGQVSDHGEIRGAGWSVAVEDVRKFEGRTAAIGTLTGTISFGPATATVPTTRRHDTERNHTATHLLHAALREALGDHVHQAGSLVAPDRLRFDFTHHGPIKPDVLARIEQQVNEGIWASVDVRTEERPYQEAVAAGAMALFGEKYGDVVRVVSIPGLSVELCGGTHVRNTGQIGLFKVVSETGVAAGVRRIEAVTGKGAFGLLAERDRTLHEVSDLLKANSGTVVRKVQGLLDERKALEKRLDEALRGGGDQVREMLSRARDVGGLKVIAESVSAEDGKALQALGDALREQMGSGVAALGATLADGKSSLLVVATDDARDRGARADVIVKDLAAAIGGRGGGKPHLAQAGVPDGSRMPEALARLEGVVRGLLGA